MSRGAAGVQQDPIVPAPAGPTGGMHKREEHMSRIVILGAGLGGVIMAYEMKEKVGSRHEVVVVNKGSAYSFVPSNPWVAVGWRKR